MKDMKTFAIDRQLMVQIYPEDISYIKMRITMFFKMSIDLHTNYLSFWLCTLQVSMQIQNKKVPLQERHLP